MFDPLHKWLGIPPSEQPPHHYRLLGIAPFEDDRDVIDAAADKQLAFLHDLSNGEHAEMAEQLSNQVSAARLCLLNNDKKRVYDESLRKRLQPSPANAATSVDPEYVVPGSAKTAAAEKTKPAPKVGSTVRVRKTSSRKRSSATRRYFRLATLMCIVALSLIGVGIYQGRIKLDSPALTDLTARLTQPETLPAIDTESPARESSQPAVVPSAATDPDPANQRGDGAGRGKSSPSTSTDTPATPNDPTLPPKPPKRSLGDLMHGGVSSAESAPIVPVPLPTESELVEKRDLIRELYAAEYRSARSSKAKLELARMMHREGEQSTDDPIGRFTLWRVSRDIMTLEGEFASAIGIVDNIDAHYIDVDALALKVETLEASADHVPKSRMNDFLGALRKLIRQCRDVERFELADSLVNTLRNKSESQFTAAFRSELDQIAADMETVERSHGDYQSAMQRLEHDAGDAGAHEVVGRYLAYYRGDWPAGLKHLAAGENDAARGAAELELASPGDDTSQAIAIADAWYDVAELESEPLARTAIELHAFHWYSAAQDDAQGIDRRKVDSRIAALKQSLPDDALESGDSPQSRMIGFRVATSPDSRSDFANRSGNSFKIGMGPRPDGRGEALAGIELEGVRTLTVVGSASHQVMPEIDRYSKTGFFVDYHTPSGYSKRVFLGLGMRPGREFTETPSWGTGKKPEIVTDIGRSSSYEIDLGRWAPSTWDGRCWFTIYMQNAGHNRALQATVSW